MKKVHSTIILLSVMVTTPSLTACGNIDGNEQEIPLALRILILIIAFLVVLAISKMLNAKEKEESKKTR